MLSNLQGSIIIAQTPFDDRGAIDLASIDTLTNFYLKHGADGFVAGDGVGERGVAEVGGEEAARFERFEAEVAREGATSRRRRGF